MTRGSGLPTIPDNRKRPADDSRTKKNPAEAGPDSIMPDYGQSSYAEPVLLKPDATLPTGSVVAVVGVLVSSVW